jgi:prepilin-type N-terminal cleavage/methylation domain-containing protein/prepilin-type processing-associated H-X9-DG protein
MKQISGSLRRLRPTRGFTLIELLVVIAIIAILAAILFPVFAQAREQARKTACLSNTKQIGIGLTMYRQDWDGHGPFGGWEAGPAGQFDTNGPTSKFFEDWQFTLQPYVKNAQMFRCPSDKVAYANRPISYLYNNNLNAARVPVSEAQVENSSAVVCIWEGCGPPASATEATPPASLAAYFPPKAFREYTIWGNNAALLASPKFGLPRHQTGGNVIYFDTHARYVNYGVDQSATKQQALAAINAKFPMNVAVAPWTAKPTDMWVWDDSGTP